MTTLWVLTIDNDDRYEATLHRTREDAEIALRVDSVGEVPPSLVVGDIDDLIGYHQDQGTEVNITEADVP